MFRLRKGLVFGSLQIAANEEVLESILVHHSMNAHHSVCHRKINAVFASTAAVEFLALPFQHAKTSGQGHIINTVRLDVERFEELKLNLNREMGQFSCRYVIEYNLEHARSLARNLPGATQSLLSTEFPIRETQIVQIHL